MPKTDKPLINFFFELGMMKKIEHCGTKFAGVKHPDSLGEHTSRTAQIGLAIALAENADPSKVILLCLIHDIGEIRIGDAHRIAHRYLKTAEAERNAVHDQTKDLPEELREKIRKSWDEFNDQKTRESRIARDADLLETMIQAKEYMDIGYKAAERWLANGNKYLKTKTAKNLYRRLKKTKFTDWWDNLNTT